MPASPLDLVHGIGVGGPQAFRKKPCVPGHHSFAGPAEGLHHRQWIHRWVDPARGGMPKAMVGKLFELACSAQQAVQTFAQGVLSERDIIGSGEQIVMI